LEIVYQTTQRYNPEESQLHIRRHQNLKSYLMDQRNTNGRKMKNYGLELKCFEERPLLILSIYCNRTYQSDDKRSIRGLIHAAAK
jgi:hypothetical protein